MRVILMVAAAAVTVLAPAGRPAIEAPRPAKPVQLAMICTKRGEQISGLNKICFYDCAGSGAALTVKSYELCPITINR